MILRPTQLLLRRAPRPRSAMDCILLTDLHVDQPQMRKKVGYFDKDGNFGMKKHDFNAGVRRRWNRRTQIEQAGAHWRVNRKVSPTISTVRHAEERADLSPARCRG